VSIGERLREERERLKLSQPAVAEAVGVSKKTQIDYEKDRTPPDANYFSVVAGLGFDISYVITGMRIENAARTPLELAFLRNSRAMPTIEARQAALDAVVGLRKAFGGKLDGEV